MKNILNETWGKLDYDEQQNRLFLNLGNANPKQFEELTDQALKAIEDYQAEDCMIDAANRVGSTEQTQKYALQHYKKAMEKGLKRMAISKPYNPQAQEIANQFIEKVADPNIKLFETNRQAINWLNSKKGLERAA